MIRQGQRITCVAYARVPGVEVGDEGLVLDVPGTYAHVRWTTGAREGQIDMVTLSALAVDRRAAHHALPADHVGLWSEDVGSRSSSLEALDMGWD